MRPPFRYGLSCFLLSCVCAPFGRTFGQRVPLLQLDPVDGVVAPLPADRGASGLRQRLLELGTVASVLQTTAHPDDEQAGLLTWFGRGTGSRTALLVLNRGEGGANAVGDELFDGLGLLRTEELLLAGRYYALDDLYFTAAVDYGYSKTLGEATRGWDTTKVLSDMVRVIRQNQPLVVVSRWYGADRDGHGHHQLAGVLTPLAVAAAADPSRFPEQITSEGLVPWRVLRSFRSNLRGTERADVTIDAGRFDPWLGASYESFANDGYARQRSQTGGRRSTSVGAAPQRLQQVAGPPVTSNDDVFSGIDTSLPAIFALTGEVEPAGARSALHAAEQYARRALATFDANAPWQTLPFLRAGLREIRRARSLTGLGAARAYRMLDVKDRQFTRAVASAIALEVEVLGGPTDEDGAPVVPGQVVPLRLTVSHSSPTPVTIDHVDWATPTGWTAPAPVKGAVVRAGVPWRATASVTVPERASPDRPYFYRETIAQNRYRWRAGAPAHEARGAAPLMVRVVLDLDGVPVTVERTVRVRQTNMPEGISFPRLTIAPPVSLRVLPAVQVVHDTGQQSVKLAVEVTGNTPGGVVADVGVRTDGDDQAAMPTEHVEVALGERRTVTFLAQLPRAADSVVKSAVATVRGVSWGDQVAVIQHRELEPAYFYSRPFSLIRRVPVISQPGLKVGYVMGAGDLVPDAISQLGAEVTLLDESDVASGEFSRFDAVVIGTRAYAVRPELPGVSASLKAYAAGGGNVVVLYQTPEFDPMRMAPYPGTVPDNAEETTEENAPVRLLAPEHALLSTPNRITPADFDGWIEQRGSKFFSRWAPEYTPLIETHDTGQAPQEGIWLTARVGAGRWTYVALALQRQLPYGVPGAYRILANLLAKPPH